MKTLSNNKLLVVGAGFGQLPAITTAKRLGIEVVVIDKSSAAPGMVLADKSYLIDIVDTESVLALAKREKINGAVTLQSDIGVPTVGAVNDALGLSGVTYEVAERCSNKALLRARLSNFKVSQPRFKVVSNEIDALNACESIGFPCIIKAPDSSGSRGVVKVSTEADVAGAFEEAWRWARDKRILVESFIPGIELGAQAFCVNGRCESVLLHDDTLSEPPYMIPTGHAFPCSLSKEDSEKATRAVAECVEALGLDDGPSNIDLIMSHDGQPYIIEVGARIGATCLPELVYYHTGIDWVECAIRSALGQTVELKPKKKQPCAAVIIESPQDGTYQGYELSEKVEHNTSVLEWEITVEPGEQVARLRKGTDRIGKVVVQGESSAAALENAEAFKKALMIKVAQ